MKPQENLRFKGDLLHHLHSRILAKIRFSFCQKKKKGRRRKVCMATGEVTVVVENIEGNMEGKTEATDNSKEKVASDRYSNSEATVKNSAMKDEDGSNKKEDENHDTRWGAFLQMWKKIFVVSCLFTVALDPLFLYVPMMKDDIKCLLADRNLKTTALLLRSLTDLFYIFDIIL
ncbi:hypothetical protein PRUPE_2G222700 [Prunus persica]|uniref:Ion transport domain-containing protein n=2 Tax=Prunus persica TaxID=3760 RepID=A0A251QK34_PRUPE|nr:hypothetical protein PRUPE_2G222700 [Prunus persica]ONI24083.1 hypothetical protein PRUPE_2G222700 [Prunus persica]